MGSIQIAFSVFHRNKKVLLRERKRHTTRRVASARYAALCNGGEGCTPSQVGGYPIQGLGGGVPHLRCRGYPTSGLGTPPHHPDLGWGTPRPEIGYPASKMVYLPDLRWGTPNLRWVPPGPEMRYPPPRPGWDTPPTQTWDGVPPPTQTWDGARSGTGYPPPPGNCG